MGGGGGSEREKLLLVWDSFLQSQEIEVEYSMSSTDDIIRIYLDGTNSSPTAVYIESKTEFMHSKWDALRY